jgi:hypothetical protein
MKAGSKTHRFLGIGGALVSLMTLAKLLSGQRNLVDVLALVFFVLLSAEGFVSYLRMKGKAEFHLILNLECILIRMHAVIEGMEFYADASCAYVAWTP